MIQVYSDAETMRFSELTWVDFLGEQTTRGEELDRMSQSREITDQTAADKGNSEAERNDDDQDVDLTWKTTDEETTQGQ
ncbi:hypothetical protein TruAng_011661 [Truncatella angustata]|nr:hypothetical protein TruAng_011661 [Truncatella angustata]